MLRDWTYRYLDRIASLDMNGAKKCILSITPPANKIYIYEAGEFWVHGTDEERASYTKKINDILTTECKERGFIYVDTYSAYVGLDGMLPQNCADAMKIHIDASCNQKLREILKNVGSVMIFTPAI